MSEATYLARAIALASQGVDEGLGGPFGAVVVHGDRVIAEASNEVLATNDPTAHAEVLAIRRAARALATFSLHGAILYASCEPCPMCLGAIFWARLDAVVYAATRAEAARAGFDDATFYEELALPAGSRRVPVRHVAADHATVPFERWLRLESRVLY